MFLIVTLFDIYCVVCKTYNPFLRKIISFYNFRHVGWMKMKNLDINDFRMLNILKTVFEISYLNSAWDISKSTLFFSSSEHLWCLSSILIIPMQEYTKWGLPCSILRSETGTLAWRKTMHSWNWCWSKNSQSLEQIGSPHKWHDSASLSNLAKHPKQMGSKMGPWGFQNVYFWPFHVNPQLDEKLI